ncbi:MAG: B12-binding domain-containing protein [Planctomycetota bacterium]
MTQLPPTTTFTPKQVALAMGVSESSVKRWCDNGRIRGGRTAGGHRKLPLASVVQFIRETGQELADPTALGMVAVSARRRPDQVGDRLYASLLEGDEPAARELILGLYQQGASAIELGDDLIGPVLRRVGDQWHAGEVSVHEERRCCEVTMAVLHELRRWIPAPAPDAPLALTATPEQDFAEVPIRLVELVLLSSGWRNVMAGSGLPLEEILAAVKLRQPQLVCLSATHLENVAAYIESQNQATMEGGFGVPVIMGGGAFSEAQAAALRCELFAPDLASLAAWLTEFASPDGEDAETSEKATDGGAIAKGDAS